MGYPITGSQSPGPTQSNQTKPSIFSGLEWNSEQILGRISTEESEEDQNDFWLSLPRTFSYQSSRFELPLNISVLCEMSPLDYVSRYVSVSSSRRQLYNKVFVRHRSLKDGLLNEEVSCSKFLYIFSFFRSAHVIES